MTLLSNSPPPPVQDLLPGAGEIDATVAEEIRAYLVSLVTAL